MNDRVATKPRIAGPLRQIAKRSEVFGRIGLQPRIMAYVTIGLVLMFGAFAYEGIQAIQRATDLVLEERLGIAHNLAATVDQSFGHVVSDVEAYLKPRRTGTGNGTQERMRDAYAHLSSTDFSLFTVGSLELAKATGEVLLVEPRQGSAPMASLHRQQLRDAATSGRRILVENTDNLSNESPLGCLVIPLSPETGSGDGDPLVAVVPLIRTGKVRHFDAFMQFDNVSGTASSGQGAEPHSRYTLELTNRQGLPVYQVGGEAQSNDGGPHAPLVRNLIEKQRPGAVLHSRPSDGGGSGHLMALVPLREAPLYLILEQDHDVALALPNELRQRLLMFGVIGFLVSLAAAWVTTSHVVKPTQQLAAAARRIGEGELGEPIQVKAQDEIGMLADTLEMMRQRLNLAHEEIALVNQELEAKVRERTARLQEVLGKVMSAQEEERGRLARELHDETAQGLSALSMALDVIRDSLPAGAEVAAAKVAEARELANTLLEETRRLIFALRPTVLDDLGLIPALRWHAEEHLGNRGVNVELISCSLSRRLPDYVEVALFRIGQEAMNNVARHARASRARIELLVEGPVVKLTVADDGVGFDPQGALRRSSKEGGVGLAGMQERVSMMGGTLEIVSGRGRGTEVRVAVPLPEGVD